MTKPGPLPSDELENVLESIRNKSRGASGSEAPNTRSGFQNKLDQFVKETKSELNKKNNEMN